MSASIRGTVGSRYSETPSISADGELVAFASKAFDLIPDDNTNNAVDIFVRDTGLSVTTLISVAWDGGLVRWSSSSPAISADGRSVAFASKADNLVPGDTNGDADIFVRDLVADKTTLVSVSSDEVQANDNSEHPSIAGNGRFVAFESRASNLVGSDATGQPADRAVFVRDLVTGRTHRMSVSSDGSMASNESFEPEISANGRFVTFTSRAKNLVLRDTNNVTDVFVRDRRDKVTTRVSLADDGVQGNALSDAPSISANGRFVAFRSDATNLVWGDTNLVGDIFVHDATSGLTRRMSVSSSGKEADGPSGSPAISADGQVVAFSSYSHSLLPDFRPSRTRMFARYRLAKETELVSIAADGADPKRESYDAAISADGSAIAFVTPATNMVFNDYNHSPDIFLRR